MDPYGRIVNGRNLNVMMVHLLSTITAFCYSKSVSYKHVSNVGVLPSPPGVIGGVAVDGGGSLPPPFHTLVGVERLATREQTAAPENVKCYLTH